MKTIRFHIDVVTPLNSPLQHKFGPWMFVPDFNINKLYMDANGIHSPTSFDFMEDTLALSDTLTDIRNRTTEFCYNYGDLSPSEEKDFSASEQYRWRAKIFNRFILMNTRGFHVRNSPFLFHEWADDEATVEFCNGEDACCISHDVFTTGTVMVKFKCSKSPMTISSLVQLFSNPTQSFQESILIWELVCPVSKSVTALPQSV